MHKQLRWIIALVIAVSILPSGVFAASLASEAGPESASSAAPLSAAAVVGSVIVANVTDQAMDIIFQTDTSVVPTVSVSDGTTTTTANSQLTEGGSGLTLHYFTAAGLNPDTAYTYTITFGA